MKFILFLPLLLALSSAVKVIDDGKVDKTKISSTKAPFEEVEHSVINVTLPAEDLVAADSSSHLPSSTVSTIFSDSGVLASATKEAEKSNVKPRKGVTFETSSTPSDVSSSSTTAKTNTSYSVSEKVIDVENKNPPQLLNENSTILSSVLNFHPIGGKPVIGEVKEVTPAAKEKPKKPLQTVSAVDDPTIEEHAKSAEKVPSISTHLVEEPVPAMSQERIPEDQPSFNGYFGYMTIAAVVLLFIAVPIVFGRKIKDHWNTRHYRRVDFLVDGMYND
ncbi:uncharacterized protein LOC134836840 [Culicoides brevitarsis]|uniref:uncharacterized protein LOC134836840 n=1 Tax=Culicoides brevitarsis TaxID=469753 RepID=UPI00307BA6D5